MDCFIYRYLGSMPNTYTFSKRIAEQVINDYSKDLPTVIIRPSIGTCSKIECNKIRYEKKLIEET